MINRDQEGARLTVISAELNRLFLRLLELLKTTGYHFVTPTPGTHARVISRPDGQVARTMMDVLGWNLPYIPGSIDEVVEDLLERAKLVDQVGRMCKSRVRVSSLHGQLFLHSAFPTDDWDAVFFGPDSYRFADLVSAELEACGERQRARIVDVGTGAGVGAIVAALACPNAVVSMTDVNPKALRFARINAAAAGVAVTAIKGDSLDAVPGAFDVIMANPPYILDPQGRAYRDGGEMHGAALSLRMARDAVARIAPGGRLILYTGSAIVRGRDQLRTEVERLAHESRCRLRYRELDPDVFGEELDNEAYADVDRIALVAAILTIPD